jgi:UDP:flavonoid glycosyltransferase YjiC (YdhE family)
MSTLPQLQVTPRAPRLHLDGGTPAVVRFPDGERISGSLEVVSLSGGLLALDNTLEKGSQVKLMFVTGAGSVLAAAEMLAPVSRSRQPFRFVELARQDRHRLESIIPVSVYQDIVEPDWMKKLRAASQDRYIPKKNRRMSFTVCAVGLITIGLMAVIALAHLPLLRLVGK